MTEPLTQVQVEVAVREEAKNLRDLVETLSKAAQRAAEAETDFKVSFARERLKARAAEKITEAKADDLATVETAGQRLDHLIAENALTTIREGLRASQSRLSALQSLLASIVRVT